MTNHKIAVIAGDGIGKEVVPEGMRVLDAAGRKFGFEFQWDELPWSCDYYRRARPHDARGRAGADPAATRRSSWARSACRPWCRTMSRSGAC